jgi:hypothetical protein
VAVQSVRHWPCGLRVTDRVTGADMCCTALRKASCSQLYGLAL